jgi:hypothetical protein
MVLLWVNYLDEEEEMTHANFITHSSWVKVSIKSFIWIDG